MLFTRLLRIFADLFCDMDLVITYVNGNDPFWQSQYQKYTNTPILEKRFRDWGTLVYLFRGIETFMPFIRKVHLVVSSPSQIPSWIDTQTVNIVLHEDIIPKEYLPTFNSNTIEMHLHKIKDLDEHYLYFNDDIFPIAPLSEETFFRNGKGVIRMSSHYFACGMFKKICRNSDKMARKALSMRKSARFLRPQHICAPMIRKECETIYNLLENEIKASLTRTRTEKNITQYMFTVYSYLKGKIINEKIAKKHFSAAVTSPYKIAKFINKPDCGLICINDVKLSSGRFTEFKEVLHNSFQAKFPKKSIYEKA